MTRFVPALALVLLFSAASARADGPDLTGTWTGKGSCVGTGTGAKLKTKVSVTVNITDDTAANALSASFSMSGTSGVPFSVALDGCGFVATLTGTTDKGRAAVHGFDNEVPFQKFFTGDLASVSVSAPDK